jgi:hypothetical protein
LERIYNISDGCVANDFTVTLSYAGSDQTAPVIVSDLCGTEIPVTTEGDSDNDHCIYTAGTEFDVTEDASDNCDNELTLNWTVVDANGTRTGSSSLAGVVFIPGISTITWIAVDDCGLESDPCSFTVKVTIPTTTTVKLSAESTRWLDYITIYATVEGACDGYELGGTVNFEIEGVDVGNAPANLIPFGDEGYEADKNKLRATLIYKIEDYEDLLPLIDGGHTPFEVTADFVPNGSIYTGSHGETEIEIYQRLAEPKYGATGGFYTGDIVGWITTSTSNTVTVQLSATMVDNSTPTGDLRGAKVTFCYINGDGSFSPIPSAKDIPVGLVNQLDGKVGFASADVQLSLSKTAQSATFDIVVVISGGYYNNTVPFGLTTVTVARTLTKGSILGNCSVLNDKSAGQIKGANGTIRYIDGDGEPVTGIPVTDISFNVEYNRKATNPQGYLNLTVISWYDRNGVLDNKLHTYFIKSNAITSFVVGPLSNPKLFANQSIFEAKANVKELVEKSPGVYEWGSVEGNSPIRATITDGGTSGIDQIAVTFFRASGGIWFSNNWDVALNKTVEQPIETGLITVSTGTTTIQKSAEIATAIAPVVEKADLKVYPNPFSDRLRFEFVYPESVNARIDLYDMTGRMVKTIFEQPIEGGVSYEAEFRPEAIISGMYIYRMTMGDAMYNGKVTFKKE